MADFEALTRPYNLDTALAEDSKYDCITIDVGRDEDGTSVKSLKNLDRQIDFCMAPEQEGVKSATKFYVVGDWHFSFDVEQAAALAKDEASKPWKLINPDLWREYELTTHKVRTVTRQENEWEKGVARICQLIEKLPNLKHLTWMSGLPFTEVVWGVLPTTLTKLIVDIGKPIRLESTDFNRETYISQDSMKPLLNLTTLNELRLFNMRDSYQSIVWETVFRNLAENKGMDVLDLQMSSRPLVRHMQWAKSEAVKTLSVPIGGDEEYLGLEGKGILHHNYGTGEYLDDFCMRKARLASGLDETKPLPLWCLKLDGFVLDYLPFKHELSRIVLLTCGANCVDAGLRAPKTARPYNKWSAYVKNVVTHCMIVFPNWVGTFDAGGFQRDSEGDLVEQGGDDGETQTAVSQNTLSIAQAADQFTFLTLGSNANTSTSSWEIPPTPLGAISNASIRGSPVPTISTNLSVPGTPMMLPDGSADIATDVATLTGQNNLEQDALDTASSTSTTGSGVPVPSNVSGEDDNAAPARKYPITSLFGF